jgi:hypothetical protein
MARKRLRLPDALGGTLRWQWEIINDGKHFVLAEQSMQAVIRSQGQGHSAFPPQLLEYSWPVSGSQLGLHLQFASLDADDNAQLLAWANSKGLPLRQAYMGPQHNPDFIYAVDSFRAEILLLKYLLEFQTAIWEWQRLPKSRDRGALAHLARLVATLERLKPPLSDWPRVRLRAWPDEVIRERVQQFLGMFRSREVDPWLWAWSSLAQQLNDVLANSTHLYLPSVDRAGETVLACLWDITPIYADFWWDINAGVSTPECAHPLCGKCFRTADPRQIFCGDKCQQANQAWRMSRRLAGQTWQGLSAAEKREVLRRAKQASRNSTAESDLSYLLEEY